MRKEILLKYKPYFLWLILAPTNEDWVSISLILPLNPFVPDKGVFLSLSSDAIYTSERTVPQCEQSSRCWATGGSSPREPPPLPTTHPCPYIQKLESVESRLRKLFWVFHKQVGGTLPFRWTQVQQKGPGQTPRPSFWFLYITLQRII